MVAFELPVELSRANCLTLWRLVVCLVISGLGSISEDFLAFSSVRSVELVHKSLKVLVNLSGLISEGFLDVEPLLLDPVVCKVHAKSIFLVGHVVWCQLRFYGAYMLRIWLLLLYGDLEGYP